MKLERSSFAGVVLLAAVAGCGGGGGGGTTETIRAAEGGTVEIPDREVRVGIPPNALMSDTDVSLEVDAIGGYPALADAIDEVLVLEPAGTVLEVAASVTWKPAGVELDGSEQLRAYQLEDGAWRALEARPEVGSGGVVSTTVVRFAPIALTVVEAPPPGSAEVRGMVIHGYTEEPYPGLELELLQDGREIETATTDADGRYSLGAHPAGTYTVRANVPAEMNCFEDPTERMVTTTAGMAEDVFFAFIWPCE
jgi:hypothetical protein